MPDPAEETRTEALPERCMDLLVRLFGKAALIERDPVDTGSGIPLHTSEIHLLDAAGRFPEENLSQLASRLGITKGAVSQTIRRLEEKGFVKKRTQGSDRKTIYLFLTDIGKQAFLWHQHYHEQVNTQIMQEFTRMTPAEQENVLLVLARFEQVFDACPKIREQVTAQVRDLK